MKRFSILILAMMVCGCACDAPKIGAGVEFVAGAGLTPRATLVNLSAAMRSGNIAQAMDCFAGSPTAREYMSYMICEIHARYTYYQALVAAYGEEDGRGGYVEDTETEIDRFAKARIVMDGETAKVFRENPADDFTEPDHTMTKAHGAWRISDFVAWSPEKVKSIAYYGYGAKVHADVYESVLPEIGKPFTTAEQIEAKRSANYHAMIRRPDVKKKIAEALRWGTGKEAWEPPQDTAGNANFPF